MDIRIEKRFDTTEELVLDIMVKKQSVDELIAQAYQAVAVNRGVSHEAGETPKQACERVLTEPIATELATNVVMNMAYPFARSEAEDASTVGSPLFTFHGDLREGEPFRYTARWAKLPQAELSSYEPVRIKAPAQQATEEMVDMQVQQFLQANARFEKAETQRPVESGDVVSLALHTTLEGDDIEGLCFDERTYTTGVGAMPEEFERNIVGMEPGQTKEFDFEGVADYDADEQPIMKTYRARATVACFMQQVLPRLTDEWVAATVPGCSTVEGMRARIRERLDEQLATEHRHYVNYLAASELAKRFSGRIPDVAYEAMRDELQAQFDQEAAAQGLSREEYMKQQGTDEQQHSVRMILQVRERLAQSIALDALARHLKLEVGEDDLREFFRASAPEGAEAELRRQLEGSGRMYLAYEGARRLKANDYLVSHAIFVEED